MIACSVTALVYVPHLLSNVDLQAGVQAQVNKTNTALA